MGRTIGAGSIGYHWTGLPGRAGLVILVSTALLALPGVCRAAEVRLLRVPNGGFQPQTATDERGTLHLIYFKGDPRGGDLFYVRREPGQDGFSQPIRVNSQPGSAVAAGTIRGGQIALGQNNRVHVAWNGSASALPKGPPNPEAPAGSPHSGLPMLYARMGDAQTAFEPQRNLMHTTFALDGGGTVAADRAGSVYVLWHAGSPGAPHGEQGRRLWIARSRDEGKSFSPEEPAYAKPTGACACCGVRAFTDGRGTLYVLYRSATDPWNRDMYLLSAAGGSAGFTGSLVQPWRINRCPMSSSALAEGPEGVFAAWETAEQIYWGRADPTAVSAPDPVAAPGTGPNRKYPALAINAQGEIILAWAEGTGWGRGGSVAWQAYDRNGRPMGQMGKADGLPAWSLPAALPGPGNGFTLLY